jgi:hypothetical protein
MRAIPFRNWNLLSAIYSLTEEEGQALRATEAYAFAGGSECSHNNKGKGGGLKIEGN